MDIKEILTELTETYYLHHYDKELNAFVTCEEEVVEWFETQLKEVDKRAYDKGFVKGYQAGSGELGKEVAKEYLERHPELRNHD